PGKERGAPLRTNAWTPASAGATKVGLTSSRTTTRFECGVTQIHVVPAQAGIQAKKGCAAAHECLDSGLRRSDEGGSHIIANNHALCMRRVSNTLSPRPSAGSRQRKRCAAAHECLDSGLRRSDEGGSHIIANNHAL